jgi:hypothetical protein
LRINSANKKEGMAMGISLSPVVSNIFMERFEKVALDTAEYKPAKWLRYVDDPFVVWPHGPARLQQFFNHIISVRPTIKFTTEVPFLDVLDMKQGPKQITKVYRKPTHTGRYLHIKPNHPHHVEREYSIAWSTERRSYVKIRRILTNKLKPKGMI